jgi:hypothetical protein
MAHPFRSIKQASFWSASWQDVVLFEPLLTASKDLKDFGRDGGNVSFSDIDRSGSGCERMLVAYCLR